MSLTSWPADPGLTSKSLNVSYKESAPVTKVADALTGPALTFAPTGVTKVTLFAPASGAKLHPANRAHTASAFEYERPVAFIKRTDQPRCSGLKAILVSDQ
jgi:hypothetical protein